jgi:hypothetical protein
MRFTLTRNSREEPAGVFWFAFEFSTRKKTTPKTTKTSLTLPRRSFFVALNATCERLIVCGRESFLLRSEGARKKRRGKERRVQRTNEKKRKKRKGRTKKIPPKSAAQFGLGRFFFFFSLPPCVAAVATNV